MKKSPPASSSVNGKPDSRENERIKTGIPGLDNILCGGLPKNRLYLLQGEPGTGKTTLALQYLMAGARLGEKVLYITFSETEEELRVVAESHGWDISGISLLELSAIEEQLKPEFQNTVFHPSAVEMNQTTDILLQKVAEVRPARLVFDSVSEMRMLAESPLRYRRQMLALKQFFSGKETTVLILDDLTSSPGDLQVQSIVHGVLNLEKVHPGFGDDRRSLNIVKMRGVKFTSGHHDYVIKTGGMEVFPRMIASNHDREFLPAPISSGIQELDTLLGGGLDRGTSNLFMGPAGTGKSTLAMQFAYAAAERGENAAVFAFEESMNTLFNRTRALGMDLEKHIQSGKLIIEKINPAEMSPGEFAHKIRSTVLEKGLSVVVIDSLNGYLHAMQQEDYLILQLHELLAFLGNQGVVSVLVLAQQGMMGSSMASPVDLTYLADTVMITRYFETRGSVKKAVSVVKKRAGMHETTIRELSISSHGIAVGKPLAQFQGVLTGVPVFQGEERSILKEPQLG